MGQNIGWLGTDYRKARAAAVSIDRTTIELSTYEGAVGDDELRAICRGMSPVDLDARRRILATLIAELCYQSRYREQTIAVPCGYFAHERTPPAIELAVYSATNLPADLPGRKVTPPPAYGFRLNAAFVYGLPEQPQEVDYVYEADEPPGRYLRLLVSPSNQAGGIAFPPRLDLQPCSTEVLSIHGQEVHHAFLTERYGPHEIESVSPVLLAPGTQRSCEKRTRLPNWQELVLTGTRCYRLFMKLSWWVRVRPCRCSFSLEVHEPSASRMSQLWSPSVSVSALPRRR